MSSYKQHENDSISNMKLLLELLAVVMLALVLAPARAQHHEDMLPDVYEGEDIDMDHLDQQSNILVGSMGLGPPYPPSSGSDDPTASPPEVGALRIISAPPQAGMCPPGGEKSKATVKKTNNKRIKVIFIIILPSFANETVAQPFDEAKLVGALQKASRARGAMRDFDITVSSIEYVSMRKLMRLRSLLQSTQSSGLSVKVSGEAEFSSEDEMVASELAQLLTDAPSTIFPREEFGSVQVPEATMTEVGGTSWVLPVAGALGGLACLGASGSIFIYRRGGNVPSKKKQTPDFQDEGFIPVDDPKLRAMATMSNVSHASLLSSVSSCNYGDVAAPSAEKQWNNIGYYQ
jgi:hypothetical protein